MIEIILDSFNSLFRAIDIFLKTKDLTLGAILAALAPFIAVWVKLSREKEKRARAILVERRQLQIAFNVNEIMEALKVESKWSLQEIGLPNTDHKSSKIWFSSSLKTIIRRRKNIMSFLTGKKKWLAFIIAVLVNGLNDVLGLGLSANALEATNYISGGYIAIEAILDLARMLSMRFKPKTVETTIVQPMQVIENGGIADAQYKGDTGSAV